jgi:hypothetical protein
MKAHLLSAALWRQLGGVVGVLGLLGVAYAIGRLHQPSLLPF